MYNPVLHPRMGSVLTLSQTEMGQLIGMSRQSISAALKQLESDWLVSTEYGGVMVRKLSSLMLIDDIGDLPRCSVVVPPLRGYFGARS